MTSRVFSFVKSLTSWTLATVVVCAAIFAFYYYYRGNEELRTRVEREFAKAYPNHAVTVGSVRLLQGEGLQLREVSIVQPGSTNSTSRTELVFVDEAILYCTPTLEQLLCGNIDVDRVRVRGLSLFPTRSRYGSWNVGGLIPVSTSDRLMPTIVVENAQVEVTDRMANQPSVTVFRDIQATITPSHLSPEKDNRISIWTRFTNDHVNQVEIRAKVDPQSYSWIIEEGRVKGLLADANLYRRFFPPVLQAGASKKDGILAFVNGLRGEIDVNFSVAKSAHDPTPRFHIKGRFANGRFDAPRFLANPITDISAESFEIVNRPEMVGWQIKNVAASYGRTPIHVSFAHSGSLSPNCDLQAVGNAGNLNVTRELIGLLSPRLQELWLRYRFLGRVDVDRFALRRTDGRWSIDTDVTCLDASINCSYFPYPVHHTEGKIYYRHKKSLDLDLLAATNLSTNPAYVHIGAKIARPGPDFSGNISVSSHGWMRLDEQLKEAVGPTVKKVLSDLEARGEVSFKALLNREPGAKLAKDISVDVRNAGARYVSFPYPLQISQGRIHVTEDLWTFRDFVGQNDSCVVRATGNWYPHAFTHEPADPAIVGKPLVPLNRAQAIGGGPVTALIPTRTPADPNGVTAAQQGGELRAEFVATDIPCDAELRKALPAGPKLIWEGLRPRGHIDYAKIDLVHRQGMTQPEINVLAKQLQAEHDADHRGLEIQPTWFPLQMSRVTGEVKYNADGTFTISDMRAKHGPEKRAVTLQSSGSGIFRQDGTWEVVLDRIYADAFQTTPELTAALPSSLSSSMRSLQFESTLSMNGQMRFTGSSERDSFVNADWRALVGVDNGRFVLGGHPVKNIFGQFSVVGQQRPQGTINWGRASVASLMCKGVQITNIETPYRMDDQRLVYGATAVDPHAPASVANNAQPHLTARMFGGEARADGQVRFSDKYPFSVRFDLSNFNVAELARDFQMPANLTGRGEAGLEMTGNSEGTHTWEGKGGVRLRDANLAKLPALISLVNQLRARTRPDTFTSSDIQFNIDGAYVNLDQFDLHGESLSLKGQGWIAMNRQLKIAFYTLPGGEKGWLPFAKRASRQLWQILVDGTLDNMTWTSQPLPAINELLLEQAQQPAPKQR